MLKVVDKPEESQYPEWLDVELWQTFVSYRERKYKETKKNIWTPEAERLGLRKLKRFIDQGGDQELIIMNTVEGGWSGLFQAMPEVKINENPTIFEVKQYITDIGSSVDHIAFFNHYESIGWKVGGNPMVKWQAAIRTWTNKQ